MNRRHLLRAGLGTAAVASLAGCVETLSNLQLGTPIVITIHNETDRERSIVITATSMEDDRTTYDEAITAPTTQTATMSPLSNEEQHVSATLFDQGDAERASQGDYNPVDEVSTFVDQDTQSLDIFVTEDGLVIRVNARGEDAVPRNVTSDDASGSAGNETAENGSVENESATDGAAGDADADDGGNESTGNESTGNESPDDGSA